MRSGTEYVQNSGECPYCGSDDIDGGIDNSFEGDIMISDGCGCNSCGKTWAENYQLTGWIGRDENDGKFFEDTRESEKIANLEDESTKLREQVKILREALEDASFEIELRVTEDGGDAYSVTKACMKYTKALEATK